MSIIAIKRIMMAFVFALFITAGMGSMAFAQETITINKPDLGGTIQMLGVIERLKSNEPDTDENRIYLFEKQARLHVSGVQDFVTYKVLLGFGGEEVPERNTVMSLKDAWFDVALVKDAVGLRIGQFKVPYSRAMLADPDYQQFANDSINVLGFNLSYDTGLALHAKMGDISSAAGVFTGAGINTPQRYLPLSLGVPMSVLRIGYNTLDKDIFTVKQFDPYEGRSGVAFYVSGMYQKDSRVGHSTILSQKNTDVSLFYNSTWNQYLADSDYHDNLATHTQYGADVAFQTDMGGMVFNGGAEINYGKFKTDLGELLLMGGEAYIGVYIKPIQVSLRYAVLLPDKNNNFAYKEYNSSGGLIGVFPIINDNPIHEINPSISIYISRNVKLVSDLQIWLDVPVAQETGLGPYNLMSQPDQATIADPASGEIERQNTVSARMNFQLMF